MFAKPSQKARSFLGLVIFDGHVKTALWSVIDKQIVLVRVSRVLPFQDDQSCLTAVDTALQELGPESEPVNEVIFGLEPSWVGETGINDEHKPLLKKITEELSLKAVGFVVTTEALTQDLVAKQSQLQVLLITFASQTLSVSQIKRSKLFKSEKVGRSDNAVVDIVEALARLQPKVQDESSATHLPSSFLLVSFSPDANDSDGVETARQALLQYDWSDQNFLHPPTVDILPPNSLVQAVVMQGGKAVARAQGIEIDSADKNEKKTVRVEPQASSFGVPISNSQLPKKELESTKSENKLMKDTQANTTKKKNSNSPFKKWILHHKKFVLIGFTSGLLALIISAVIVAKFFSVAVVVITPVKKTLVKEVEITLDTAGDESDPERLVLAAKTDSFSIDGSDTVESSGVGLTGEKTKGTVKIINKTTAEKTFKAGTKLLSDTLIFTLDSDVTVASASVTESTDETVTKHGHKEASVTAQEIGADYNLSGDKQLSIADFSQDTYTGTVVDKLSGGSSREIRVVSQKDRDKLLSSLEEELIELGKIEMQQKAEENKKAVFTGKVVREKVTFDAEAGDEVDSLSLELELGMEIVVYETTELSELADKILLEEVPPGYTLIPDSSQVLSGVKEDEDGTSTKTLRVNLSSFALPELDLDKLRSEILGFSPQKAKDTLSSREEIKKIEIKRQPSLIEALLISLPSKEDKIEMKIAQ